MEDEEEEPMEEEESSAREEEDEEKTNQDVDMEMADNGDNENKADPTTTTADPDQSNDLEAEESNAEKVSSSHEVESKSAKKDDNLDEGTNKTEEDLDESDSEDEDLNEFIKSGGLEKNIDPSYHDEKDPLGDVASTEPGGGVGGNGSELEIPTTEDEETSQMSASPFKRPPDSVSVDGSFSNTREPSRERHMSVNSMDDGSESRMSETESERRQSANEELAAQYAQQLAFYRYPTFCNR